MNTDVAVIVPVYNGLALLPFTLDSILQQTVAPSEVIVVDDGSTEDVEPFIRNGYGNRVRCIRTTNRGANPARNSGAAMARSSWLAFCDADDLWHPRKVELQLKLLALAPDCEYSIVDYCRFDDAGLAARSHFDYAPSDYWNGPRRDFGPDGFVVDAAMFPKFLRFQPAITSTVLLSRLQFERLGGWDENLARQRADDAAFHFQCATHPPLSVVPTVLMYHRRHAASWSADGLQQRFGGVQVLEYMLAQNLVPPEHRALVRNEIESRTLECVYQAWYRGRLNLFQQYLGRICWYRRPFGLIARELLTHFPKPIYDILRQGSLKLGESEPHLRIVNGVGKKRHKGGQHFP